MGEFKMNMVDYHIHSTHSYDGRSTIFELCQTAIEVGLAEIGVTDHMEFEPNDAGYGFFNYDQYTMDIEKVRDIFKDRLVIRKGIEIDYQHCFEAEIARWLQDKDFDFIIGSVHYLDHILINYPYVVKRNLKSLYTRYNQEVIYSINSALFDVIGHFDLVSKYVDENRVDHKQFNHAKAIQQSLKTIVETEHYFELNSKWARPRRSSKIILSQQDLLWQYLKCGGTRISVGSDAHSTDELRQGLNTTLKSILPLKHLKIRYLFS
jgi:histidinol-phosphatase (PHP family)